MTHIGVSSFEMETWFAITTIRLLKGSSQNNLLNISRLYSLSYDTEPEAGVLSEKTFINKIKTS